MREFTFGHANQLAAVARAHLVALAAQVPLLPGSDERVFIDIDSLLRPVYGHHKQGASFGSPRGAAAGPAGTPRRGRAINGPASSRAPATRCGRTPETSPTAKPAWIAKTDTRLDRAYLLSRIAFGFRSPEALDVTQTGRRLRDRSREAG